VCPTAISFHFYGFLSSKIRQRATQREGLRDLDGTLVLFESSHRILRLQQQMDLLFREHQSVTAKELTRLHEQFLCGKPSELRVLFDDDKNLTRGEFVVLIDNFHNARSKHFETDERKMLGILLEEASI
jgi:16S rRNA (cytidine1402-2'-O)-methyltransferase